MIYLNGCTVNWISNKQEKVSKSPAESELLAMVQSVQEIEFIENVLKEMNCVCEIKIYIDSQSILSTIQNDTNKSKMINIKN